MQFRIHSYVSLTPVTGSVPSGKGAGLQALKQAAQDARKSACQACEFHRDDRCYRPCKICPRDERRNQPWARLPRCPDNRWLK